MSHPTEPHRFLPSPSNAYPMDLFTEQRDRSSGRYKRYFHRDDDTTILAFTDGSCLGSGIPGLRRAGWGCVYNDSDAGMSGPLEGTVGGSEQTSNRAELRAVIAFLQMRAWEEGGAYRIVIATDSASVVDGVSKQLEQWVAHQWKTKRGQTVSDRDLWIVLKQELDSAKEVGLEILFWWIPREWNSRADKLAKEGAESVSFDSAHLQRSI